MQGDHPYGLLMDLKIAVLFWKEVLKGPKLQYFAYLEGIFNTWTTHYCVKQNTVSTLAFNRTCSTFLCRHAVVISCFTLHSPFLICKQVHTHIDIAYFCEEKIKIIFQRIFVLTIDGLGWFMVFNATFNNILVILWQSVLLVEETGVLGENHRPVTSHWQTLSHNVVQSSYHWMYNILLIKIEKQIQSNLY